MTVLIYDDVVNEELRKSIVNQLNIMKWGFGWKASPDAPFSFFHNHFCGPLEEIRTIEDNSKELEISYPIIHQLWKVILTLVPNQKLIKSYANAYPYGSDGTLHKDIPDSRSLTWIFYPNNVWHPNWAGETVFFNGEEDICFAAYPKPRRLISFPGYLPHIARGISRQCPYIRITVVFKTIQNG
jgi:SM-20-related protein